MGKGGEWGQLWGKKGGEKTLEENQLLAFHTLVDLTKKVWHMLLDVAILLVVKVIC